MPNLTEQSEKHAINECAMQKCLCMHTCTSKWRGLLVKQLCKSPKGLPGVFSETSLSNALHSLGVTMFSVLLIDK